MLVNNIPYESHVAWNPKITTAPTTQTLAHTLLVIHPQIEILYHFMVHYMLLSELFDPNWSETHLLQRTFISHQIYNKRPFSFTFTLSFKWKQIFSEFLYIGNSNRLGLDLSFSLYYLHLMVYQTIKRFRLFTRIASHEKSINSLF